MSTEDQLLIKLLLAIGQRDEAETEIRSFTAQLLSLEWCRGIRFWHFQHEAENEGWVVLGEFDALRPGADVGSQFQHLHQKLSSSADLRFDFHENAVLTTSLGFAMGIVTDRSGQWLAETVNPIKPALEKFVDYAGRRWHKKMLSKLRSSSINPLDSLARNKMLQQRVMATLSHEFRNPLNLILGYTALLQETSLSPQQKDYISIIKDSGHGLYQTVKKVFQFLHVATGRMVDEEMDFRLSDLVKLLESELKPQAEAKGLKWSVNLASEVSTWLRGDMPKLHDILYYIIENSIKFSSGGQIELTVRFTEKHDNNMMFFFEVRDQGKGVQALHQYRIFEFFNQEDDGITRNYGGLGLGLSLSDLFAKHLGGKLSLKSATGLGTSISFSLGFKECTDSKPFDVAAFMFEKAQTENIGVLIVDDDVYQRKMAAHILRNWKVNMASNGMEAVEFIRNHPETAIILMDIRMPEMDGITATRVIRNELQFKAPIIAVSGEALEATIEECFEAGMNAFVSKPFDGEQLVRTMVLNCERLLQSRPEIVQLRPADKLSGLKGLVVEDNKMIQLLTMRYLRDLECRAELAPDVETALQLAGKNKYDFILLDLHLPDGSGFEIAKKVREADKEVCLIAYSGEDSEETRQQCIEAGINGTILKTYYSPHELAIKINRFIDEYKPPRPPVTQTTSQEEMPKDFDLTKLREMIGGNSSDLVLLLEVFVEHSGKTLQQLIEANNNNDIKSLSRFAHSLKASAKQFGMDRAAELLLELEQRNGVLSDEERMQKCNELEQIFKRTLPALSAEIEKLKN